MSSTDGIFITEDGNPPTDWNQTMQRHEFDQIVERWRAWLLRYQGEDSIDPLIKFGVTASLDHLGLEMEGSL